MTDIKYPDIKVRLIGEDGNGFVIVGRVMRALRRVGLSDEVIEEYREDATSGDYDHLLQTTMRWVEVS